MVTTPVLKGPMPFTSIYSTTYIFFCSVSTILISIFVLVANAIWMCNAFARMENPKRVATPGSRVTVDVLKQERHADIAAASKPLVVIHKIPEIVHNIIVVRVLSVFMLTLLCLIWHTFKDTAYLKDFPIPILPYTLQESQVVIT